MAEVPSDAEIISTLADDLPVGLWVARAPAGEFVYANRTFGEIMGTVGLADPKAGGYASPYGIFTRDGVPYPEAKMPFVRALEEKRVVVVDDLTIRRPDGARVDVRAFARPVTNAAGAITHVVIAFFDITREVHAQQARAESEHRLARAQRLESIGTLAGGIAHDFNNLIFGIKLIGTELAIGETDARRLRSLALVDDITERAATLTRSLLGFARRGKQRPMPVALDDVIAAMRELLTRALGGIALEFELGATDRGPIVADRTQLEQVVLNLVLNARDAVKGTGRVRVTTRSAAERVILEVADDGPGVPDGLRERVFEPYFTTKTKGPDHGTGLGLATVLGIVESHGGTIEIGHGLVGRGATFRVALPKTDAIAASAAGAIVRGEPARGSGTILVVDDDDIVRRAITLAIENLGYDTAAAASGAEAVELFRRNPSAISAVVLDMVMPGMNGRATYLALRDIVPEIPVLLMSGFTLDDEVQTLLELGVRRFVAKPCSVDDLARELAAIVG